MVPTTALAIPTYLLFARAGLTDTPWAVILPVAGQPVRPLPDAGLRRRRRLGRADRGRPASTEPESSGSSSRIALRLLAPGIVTVLLFTLVATWNNYFLPLIMLQRAGPVPPHGRARALAAQAAAGGSGAQATGRPP